MQVSSRSVIGPLRQQRTKLDRKPVFGAVNRIASGIAIAANAAGTFVVVAMILLVNYDIIARGVFNRPFMGTVEVVQFSMVLIVFLQLPDVVRSGRLTRSDGFLELLRTRRPAAGQLLSRGVDGISCAFMVLVTFAIWPEFVEMWETKDYFGVPGVFTAPWWPVKLVIFLSACLCAVHFALKTLLPERDTLT